MTSRNAATAALLCIFLASCSSVAITQSGALSSYSNLSSQSRSSDAKTFVDRRGVASARTIAIVPASLSASASAQIPTLEDGALVANAVDRAMCLALAEKFEMVRSGNVADITIHATVSNIVPTGKTAAGISKVATLGTSAVLPVGVPRLPIGLGGLAVEIEALDAAGQQKAAMTWAKGANSITSSARISEIGDAYGLAGAAGRRFARIIAEASDDPGFRLPSAERVATSLGGRSRSEVCEDFGRSTGFAGLAGSMLGAPPSWSDGGYRQ